MKHLRRIGLVLTLVLTISSAVSAQDPSVLLEKAIYTEETLGNLGDAIRIYQQVLSIAAADRATGALALYRLGMCYQKSGRAADAQSAFSKLTKLYPEQKDLIAKTSGASSNRLDLRAAPWIDGEVLHMATKLRSGNRSGTQIHSIASSQESGKTLWKLTSVEEAIGGSGQFVSLLMDTAGFAPVRSIQNTGGYGEYQARYAPQRVEFLTKRRGSSSISQISVDRPVYDYAQLAHLVRCLPLREAFQTSFLVSTPEKATVLEAKIAVAGRENVAVNAGTFDCYKAILSQADGEEKIYWISSDIHSYIVKVIDGTLTFELDSISIAEKNQPVRYEDGKSGISLEAPCGWFATGYTTSGQHLIFVTGPEGDAEARIQFWNLTPDEAAKSSLNRDADQYIEEEQKQYKEFVVRPGSRETITVSGLNGIRHIVDFKKLMTEEDTVRYQFFLASSTRQYIIRFETGKANFDRLRPVFDSIISSLRQR
jgi:tetratricopeptide (TPR) repeat protein